MMLRYSPVDQVLNGYASVVCVAHKAPEVDLEEEEIAVICAVLEGINGEEDANAVVRLMRHFGEPVPDFFSSEEFVRLYVQPGRFRLGDLSQEWKDWARRECFPQGSSAPPEKPQETDRKTLVTNEQMERGLARHFGVAPDEFISRVALLVDPPAGMPLKDLAFSCYKSDLCDSDCELVMFAIDLGASPTDKGRKVLEQQSLPGNPMTEDDRQILLNADRGYKTYTQIAEMYGFDHRTKEKLRKKLQPLNKDPLAARNTRAGRLLSKKTKNERQGKECIEPFYEYNVENDSVKAAIRDYFQSDTATQE